VKNNIAIGLLLGAVAGVLDVVPMILQRLTWDANLSAFFLWVVSGFMLATSNLRLHPVLKGIVIPFICLLPSMFIIGWNEPLSLVPIGVMTLILGALLGFAYGKLSK
jgi:CHASE2 domain-containing sensor protein